MNTSANNSSCPPLMEACTLALYQKNIFRVTGLPVDATSKEVSRQAQKLQMLEEMGGGSTGPQPAFPLAVPPTTDEIRAALSRMREPEHRIVDEFFWYWPEEFGASKSDPAIQAMLAGNTESAVRLWRDREKGGSHVARHNMAIMYHMYAVDWSNYHVSFEIDQSLDEQIKGYWRKSFERWEVLIEAEDTWNMLKERVRSLNDEALTTGFVRRMLKQLPIALDRVNAEAALKLAEQSRMDWARFHVNLMRETHQGLDDVDSTAELVLTPARSRLKQKISASEASSKDQPTNVPQIAGDLMATSKPLMDLYDLFHGRDSHQRSETFDEVADLVLNILWRYRNETLAWIEKAKKERLQNPYKLIYAPKLDDDAIVQLLQEALKFSTGISIRESLTEAIEVVTGSIHTEELRPIYEKLTSIREASITASAKFSEAKQNILPELPGLASKYGAQSESYKSLVDTVALLLRSISIDAHNDSNDFKTAEDAIQLALRLTTDPDIKKRISEDIKALSDSKQNSLCYFCEASSSDEHSVFSLAMHGDVVRRYRKVEYRTLTVPIPRCKSCMEIHKQGENSGCWAWAICLVVGIVIGILVDKDIGWVIGALGGFLFGGYVCSNMQSMHKSFPKLEDLGSHPHVREMIKKGWIIGASPN